MVSQLHLHDLQEVTNTDPSKPSHYSCSKFVFTPRHVASIHVGWISQCFYLFWWVYVCFFGQTHSTDALIHRFGRLFTLSWGFYFGKRVGGGGGAFSHSRMAVNIQSWEDMPEKNGISCLKVFKACRVTSLKTCSCNAKGASARYWLKGQNAVQYLL